MLYLTLLYQLFNLSFNDPGYLPRRMMLSSQSIGKLKMNNNHKGHFIKYKICKACFIVKSLRTHHCGDCDSCIEGYDHHCTWIGNCIGKRNYYLFFYLLITIMIYCIVIFTSCIIEIQEHITQKELLSESSIDDNFRLRIVPLALCECIHCILLCIITGFVFILMLIIFINQCINLNSNLTTKESLLNKYNSIYNEDLNKPFINKGFFTNLIERLDSNISRKSLQDIMLESKKESTFNSNKIFFIKTNDYITGRIDDMIIGNKIIKK